MKLSLAWIFDHIEGSWTDHDPDEIVAKFNQITAEIEEIQHVSYDLSQFGLAKIMSCTPDQVTVHVPEWGEEAVLPLRKDISALGQDKYSNNYVLVHRDGSLRYAQCKDFGLDKGGALPLFTCPAQYLDGSWRDHVEAQDVILEIDNKSITHRPDMWGHRGFAREVAAFMGLQLKPLDDFVAAHPVTVTEGKSKATATTPFTIENKATDVCSRYSGLYFPTFSHQGANLFIAFRLFKVGSRSIDAIVDLTNYVMQDLSQPVHAFDAAKLTKQKIVVRHAKTKEKFTLLDEREVALTNEDLVIADAKVPVALAGVMGGLDSAVTQETTSLFFESAHFAAVSVRRSALRHKSRTDSSTRFEKTLDPNQITDATQRFLKLAGDIGLQFTVADEIMCVGQPMPAQTIQVPHKYLVTRAGFDLTSEQVTKPLTTIGFEVAENDGVYTITIPSYRAAKDVQNREDILEEVVRFYGFNNIKLVLPTFAKEPASLQSTLRPRAIKNFFRDAAGFCEQQNYAFYDEPFLTRLGYDPSDAPVLKNPASELQTRLATSLIPSLLKNLQDNVVDHDELRFFELGRIWKSSGDDVLEKKSLAGIFFNKRGPVDFYECKGHIDELVRTLGFEATWEKVEPSLPWMQQHRTAQTSVNGEVIGHAGTVDSALLQKLDVLPESEAFFFELNADWLINAQTPVTKFKPISKYQDVTFDLSFMVPLALETKVIENALATSDGAITRCQLLDFFEKPEWQTERALAFRLLVRPQDKTLQKDEIDAIRARAVAAGTTLGAVLRA